MKKPKFSWGDFESTSLNKTCKTIADSVVNMLDSADDCGTVLRGDKVYNIKVTVDLVDTETGEPCIS